MASTKKTSTAAERKEGEKDDAKNYREAWMRAKERALRVLVCGIGGVGKSTLINRLLQLEGGKKVAEEGMEGKAKTSNVSKYERITKRGIKVCLFDSPGFEDADISNEEIIAMMSNETKGALDVIFYCFTLDNPARVQKGDIRAIQLMTETFGEDIWKKGVIVCTFANNLEEKKGNAQDYFEVINNIKLKVKEVLQTKCRVPGDIVEKLPVLTAGHTEPILRYEAEDCKNFGSWDNRLFFAAVDQVDPAVFPAMFEVRYSWTELLALIGEGSAVGGIVGGLVGGVVGAMGGPIGATAGIAAGAAIGASATAYTMNRIATIKFNQWKMKNRPTSPYQETHI